MRPCEVREALELPTSLEVARRLAGLGLRVFPCGPDKTPRTAHGYLDASTEPVRIRAWFRDSVLSVGVVPSSAGLAVMDLDVIGESGLALASAQVEAHTGIETEDHPHRVITPSGGCHLWFSIGSGRGPSVANSYWPGVDFRGDGGYVIVWSPVGGYRLDNWDMDPDTDWCTWPLPDEPDGSSARAEPATNSELHTLIGRRDDLRHRDEDVGYVLGVLAGVGAGGRHAAGLRALGRLFGSGTVNPAKMLPVLRDAWMSLPGPANGRAAEWVAMVKWIAGQELAKNNEPAPDPPVKVPWTATPVGVREAMDRLGFRVRFNSRRQRIEVSIPERLRVSGQWDWSQITEQVEALLVDTVAAECETTGKNPKPPITSMRRWREWLAWCQVGDNPVDPFVEWLNGLPDWDGEPRADYWLYLFAAADDTSPEVIQYVSRLVPMACVKRALEPGCSADIMPVLVGPQGIGKSRSLRALMAETEWFSDSLSLQDDLKTWVEKSLKPVLIEVAEMAGASRSEVAKLKSILSATKDEVRLAYRRDAEEYPRRFFPVGTANDRRTLPNDPTGNRRFAVVNFVGNTREHPDANSVVRAIVADRDQIFAEALARVRSGESIFPDPVTAGLLASAAEGARVDDTEVEAIVNGFLEARGSKFHVGGLIRETRAWLSPDTGEQLPSRALDARVIRALELAGCVRDARKSRGIMEGDIRSVVRYWWAPPGGVREGSDHAIF